MPLADNAPFRAHRSRYRALGPLSANDIAITNPIGPRKNPTKNQIGTHRFPQTSGSSFFDATLDVATPNPTATRNNTKNRGSGTAIRRLISLN